MTTTELTSVRSAGARILLFLVGLFLLADPARAQIRFGSTLTLSGSGAAFGQNARDGMELAREAVNAAGGIGGKPLEIVYEDIGETDLKRAVSAARKFVDVDKVAAVLPMITEDSEVIWPVTKSRVIAMAVYAGGREVTKDKPFMFQVSSSDEIFGRTLSDFALRRGITGMCLLTEQSAYSVSIGKFSAEYWRERTGREALYVEYGSEVSDFKPYILKMRASGCGAVMFLTSINRQGTALAQMRAMGWNPLKLGLDTSEDPNILTAAGAAIDGLVYVKYLVGTAQFAEQFRRQYGREIGFPAALGYDAVMVLAKAMNGSGISKEAVSTALFALRDYPGASGPLTFDADGTRHERVPHLWRFAGTKSQPEEQ